MGILNTVKGLLPPWGRGRSAPVIQARYDAAQTTDSNRKHWSVADALSADAENREEVRRILRNRARYECANNSYCKGIHSTIANDTIGPGGPTLQLTDGSEQADATEREFQSWARSIRLANKLWQAVYGADVSGEVFVRLFYNPAVKHPVKLDIAVYEADYVGSSFVTRNDPNYYDGIIYDSLGNPVSYELQKRHPGDLSIAGPNPLDFETVDADLIWHLFKAERPGQRRGIPRATPALPLFAVLRRYGLAVVECAETAANYTAVVQSDASSNGEDNETPPASWDLFEIERNTGLVLPRGFTLSQLKPEQPTTTFDMFVNAVLREIARCMNVPLTIASLDSSKSNLSAAYLDGQSYGKSIEIKRRELELMLDWIGRAFFRMRSLARDEAGEARSTLEFDDIAHVWQWPPLQEHADPSKVASAKATRLRAGVTTLPLEYAKAGLDCNEQLAAQAKALGIPVRELQKVLLNSIYGPMQQAAQPNEESDDEDRSPDDRRQPAPAARAV